jgi:hypothetical protein
VGILRRLEAYWGKVGEVVLVAAPRRLAVVLVPELEASSTLEEVLGTLEVPCMLVEGL